MGASQNKYECTDQSDPIKSRAELEKVAGLWPIHWALAVTFGVGILVLVIIVGTSLEMLGFKEIQHQSKIPLSSFFDILKLGFAAVAGIGAAVALVTTYRRQRVAEAEAELNRRSQDHAERVAEDSAYDATVRRVTELFGRAVEQLGHDKAAVRLGGLYSLERVANENPEQRQTVVDVICAYLRMPFNPPGNSVATMRHLADDENRVQEGDNTESESRQELQVRRAAQGILERNLCPRGENGEYWNGVYIDLNSATLVEFNLSDCIIRGANFWNAHFAGYTWFRRAVFAGRADFGDAKFDGYVTFEAARFRDQAWFAHVEIGAVAEFKESIFEAEAYFADVNIHGAADFESAEFMGEISYSAQSDTESEFGILFMQAKFRGPVRINPISSSSYDFTGAFVEGGELGWLPLGWDIEFEDAEPAVGRIVRRSPE